MACNAANLSWVGPASGPLDNNVTFDIGGYNSGGQWTFLKDSGELIQAAEYRYYQSVPFVNTPCDCGGTLEWALGGGTLPPGLQVNTTGGYVYGTVGPIFDIMGNPFYTANSAAFNTGGTPTTETIGDNAYVTKTYNFTINCFTSQCNPVPRNFYIIVVKFWDNEEQNFITLDYFKNPVRTGAPYV